MITGAWQISMRMLAPTCTYGLSPSTELLASLLPGRSWQTATTWPCTGSWLQLACVGRQTTQARIQKHDAEGSGCDVHKACCESTLTVLMIFKPTDCPLEFGIQVLLLCGTNLVEFRHSLKSPVLRAKMLASLAKTGAAPTARPRGCVSVPSPHERRQFRLATVARAASSGRSPPPDGQGRGSNAATTSGRQATSLGTPSELVYVEVRPACTHLPMHTEPQDFPTSLHMRSM